VTPFGDFFDLYGERAAEVAWQAGLQMIAAAAREASEGTWGRWRSFPQGELRRLRRDLTAGLWLCRLAVHAQAEVNERAHELTADLMAEAREAGRLQRRAGTREATVRRLARAAAAKRLGRTLGPWEEPAAEELEAAAGRVDELWRGR
jgi:histone H3/H4